MKFLTYADAVRGGPAPKVQLQPQKSYVHPSRHSPLCGEDISKYHIKQVCPGRISFNDLKAKCIERMPVAELCLYELYAYENIRDLNLLRFIMAELKDPQEEEHTLSDVFSHCEIRFIWSRKSMRNDDFCSRLRRGLVIAR